MTISLAVVETQNNNPDRHPDLVDVGQWIELQGYVVEEPQQNTLLFALERPQPNLKDDQTDLDRYDKLVGERRVVSVWAKGNLLRFSAKLQRDGFEIPYPLTNKLDDATS